ncbi:hypothetical protein ABN028_19925 [Actinopolymorpha sp. B17G11]|uniref:hypothetical protein n=1 Tax=Actinopolymorpha sp. B17G11 TaxID=3160861 RepID=UPI0032E48D0D
MTATETETTEQRAPDARTDERPLPPIADPLPAREPRMLDVRDFLTRAQQLTPEARAAIKRALDNPDAVDAEIDALDARAMASRDAEARAKRWEQYTRMRDAQRTDFADSSYARLYKQQRPEIVAHWWERGELGDADEDGADEQKYATLLLAGPSGHGKTDAGHAITNEVAAADRDARIGTPPVVVRVWSVVDLLRMLAPPDAHVRYDEVRSAARDRALHEAKTCDLLLLDDLGKERESEWVRAVLFEILDARASNKARGRRTVITLNYDENDPTRAQEGTGDLGAFLSKRYGSAVFSRIKDAAIPVKIQGKELRQMGSWNPI